MFSPISKVIPRSPFRRNHHLSVLSVPLRYFAVIAGVCPRVNFQGIIADIGPYYRYLPGLDHFLGNPGT